MKIKADWLTPERFTKFQRRIMFAGYQVCTDCKVAFQFSDQCECKNCGSSALLQMIYSPEVPEYSSHGYAN